MFCAKLKEQQPIFVIVRLNSEIGLWSVSSVFMSRGKPSQFCCLPDDANLSVSAHVNLHLLPSRPTVALPPL